MAALTKFHQFIEDLYKKKHDFSVDVFKVALTNVAPSLANTGLADITQIAAGNGYTTGGFTLAGVTAEQVTGSLTVTATDLVVTATGGSMAAWRYAVVYNDTAAGDLLVGYADRGSSVTLAVSESETLDFTTGALINAT